ncbi:MAG TPA: hypothetical protein DEB17_07605 [Chlorobaculum sp.]|uniref:Uncharacterized protein n=1 Tax=Chlorobaculum tepidum (strain ATCC 49652 / DSM 12025 / NBRC 103806 / TLS) TaxID=194439 RepID=Q8KFG0_CHLTE|nr:hypothetical protein [Chlorobaculum tepidum]AAM71612.1 hypothetical protein CT0366 [Chlorobaculum tepidum TLS]HBU23838.1 hypothetical protein [Chlorobaculum sp.]
MPSSPKKQKRKAEAAAKQPPAAAKPAPATMPLGAMNYLFIALGATVLALSYAVMYIEKSVDGFFALDIAPFTLVGAYAWILFAIFYRSKKKKN